MLRKIVRVLAIMMLVGSVVIGSFAVSVYLTPSDEEKLYDQKHQEAVEKLQKAEAAKGTAAEALLSKEAREAAASADAWGQGYRERTRSNRLGVLASAGVAFLSFIVLLLTFVNRKNNVGVSEALNARTRV
ncbi:MAG TPA: hypothetical protein VGV87_02030 [Blastocatellia bacterium]|jgi:hypothetical protein|nr:hypothetical protein [Blastocatellia bacterium]